MTVDKMIVTGPSDQRGYPQVKIKDISLDDVGHCPCRVYAVIKLRE